MTTAGTPTDTATGIRVRGLDSIRFICAAWVMIGHAGPLPYVDAIDQTTALGFIVRGALHHFVSGPAAVIVFFVISGFCIHFPYRHATSVELFPYFARRHTRILLPVAAAILLGAPLGIELPMFQDSILWSLVCEEIYYTLFPVLLKGRARWGWPILIGIAFAAAYTVVLTNHSAGNYPSYGAAFNWVLGLPCWLLGCQLAESWDEVCKEAAKTRSVIWKWRLGVLVASMVCSVLRFHTSVTYPWTLDIFAIIVAFWLKREIVTWQHRSPFRPLELGGLFSYSIYLVHLHGFAFYTRVGISPNSPIILEWLWRLIFVLALCFVFYKIVEQPSHRLARWLYHVLMARRPQKSENLLQRQHEGLQ